MVLVLNKPSATGCCCSLQPAEIDRGGEEGQAVSDAEGKPAEEPKELVADARILVAGFDASFDRLGAMGCLASCYFVASIFLIRSAYCAPYLARTGAVAS